MNSGAKLKRTGSAAVEAAVVLPLLVLLLLGGVDVGRAIMVQHKLVAASRAGCRMYCMPTEATQSEATAMIGLLMSEAEIAGYTVNYVPASSAEIGHQQSVTVSVSVPYDGVAWIRSWFLIGRTLTGSCTMPGDTNQVGSSG